jgi:hypothetical protein
MASKKILVIALILLMIGTGFVFALDAMDLWVSLGNGVNASEGAINTLRSINKEADVERNLDRLLSQANTAENAVLDSINYLETNGQFPNSSYQQRLNQIKSNLRQMKSKLESFGYELGLAFNL